MLNKYAKGSEWRKWDLHIHSPLSILNNQYPKLAGDGPNWDAFLSKLEATDLAVVGITDYFTIEGYKALLEFKAQGRLQNIETILPNIELRLKSVISSKKDGRQPRRLNFHVIFSDEVSAKDIEEHFLHDLNFYYEGNPQNRDGTRKLKISNLEELGKTLLSQHKPFQDRGLSQLQVGAMQAVVDHEEITEILSRDSRFRGKYIFVLPEEFLSLIDWDGQDHHVRKGLLQKSDMVFSSNQKTRHWCLGEDPYEDGEKNFIREFKTLKPCIHGSDAHRVEDISRPCALRGQAGHGCELEREKCELRFCWIKADPTFEGFKQLLYEPTERVVVQESNPTPVMSSRSIARVIVDGSKINEELTIAKTDLKLNTGLVAVVGGKGAGKTAFVDLVANCYFDRCSTDDKNSFVRRIVDQRPKIPVELEFRDGSRFSKELTEKKFIEDGQVVYIAQGELERYIGDESDLDKYINGLIFESPHVKDLVKSFEYLDLIETTRDIEHQISAKNKLIEGLENKTKTDVAESISREKKRYSTDLEDIEKRIGELEKVQSQENIDLAKQKQEHLGSLKDRRDTLIELRDSLKASLQFLDEELPDFNARIQSVNALLKELKIEKKCEELAYARRSELEDMLVFGKKEISTVVGEIEKAQKEIEHFERSIREHTELLNRKHEINVELDKLVAKSREFESEKKQLENAISDRKELIKKLFESIISQKKKYDEIIEDFSSKKFDVLADLSFLAEIRFDASGFLEKAEGVLDNRKVNIRGDNATTPAFDKLIKLSYAVAGGDESKVDALVQEIENCSREFRTKIKSTPISMGHFYSLLYGNYLCVIPTVKYKNTNIEKLSLGQKATVLIKIYLAQGDKPIIIDSHDDHLDNEFIMEELVKAIRQAKNFRQVILVSNNGNVVINSDAEQIVLANRCSGEISYISGSIENPEIRDRALRVLEGGSEAFRKRQQKYRLGI